MPVWGGHSCPPPLNLILIQVLPSVSAQNPNAFAPKSKSKAADKACPERSRRECPAHTFLLLLTPTYGRGQRPLRQPGGNLVPGFHVSRIFQERTRRIEYQRVPTIKDG